MFLGLNINACFLSRFLPRRMLIVFHPISKKNNNKCIYIDLYIHIYIKVLSGNQWYTTETTGQSTWISFTGRTTGTVRIPYDYVYRWSTDPCLVVTGPHCGLDIRTYHIILSWECGEYWFTYPQCDTDVTTITIQYIIGRISWIWE